MCVFPFVFKPIFIVGMQADKQLFDQLMLERIKIVPQFIIDSIKK